jgi:hypothetical protein
MKKNERNSILPIKPSYALAASVGIVAVVAAVAWLNFSPAYETNDDVGIRLILEGRLVPDATPSGHAIFLNLAMGQALAWLYRHMPGMSWYDAAEQGTLVLAAIVGLYCCLRVVRLREQATMVAFMAAAIFTATVLVQFTIVAVLAAMVGTAALAVSVTVPKSQFERSSLSGAGALLLVVGTMFRLEAALFAVTSVAVIALPAFVETFRRGRPMSAGPVLAIAVAALAICGLAWFYHFFEYFHSPAWRDYYLFNTRRAELTELADARLPLRVLNDAFAAVGWRMSDYNMMKEWLFFDPTVFSLAKLDAIVARLPIPSPPGLLAVAGLLASYVKSFPFILIAIAGVVSTASRFRSAVTCVLSLVALVIIITAVSYFLKPLPYRVFWPLAVGAVFTMWIVVRFDRPMRPHWILRAASAVLIAAAGTMMTAQTLERMRSISHTRQLALLDLVRAPIRPKDLIVIVGSWFPYEFVERPFGSPYLQRAVKALPLAAGQTAPSEANFIRKVAHPDMATWLCSDADILLASGQALTALTAYYRDRRKLSVRFSTLFTGNTFSAYRCSILR